MLKTNWRQVFHMIGFFLIIEAIFMVISACVSVFYQEDDLFPILQSAGITGITGLVGIICRDRKSRVLGNREGYLIVGITWVIFSFFGMLPFTISGAIPSVADAYFETISGFTTTGASILNNIEELPHGLLFWRSMTQWMGGMGIIVLTLAVMPSLSKNIKLFSVEVPGPTLDKLTPRIQDTARNLWTIYSLITLVEIILLKFAGMNWFDAVCHSFTTISTGGFSTKQASIGHWSSPMIQYIIITFMVIGGTNFSLLYAAYKRKKIRLIWKSEEFKFFLRIISGVTLFITLGLLYFNGTHGFANIEQQFRNSLFSVVTCISTCGFGTTDFAAWRPLLWMPLLLVMLSGSMAGSTTGGMKLVRILTLKKNVKLELKQLMHPNAILPVRIDNKVVKPKVVNGIHAFIVVYIFVALISVLILNFNGLSVRESFGAAITTLGGVGPGLGMQGPAGNFADISDFCKWYLSFLMLIGRLEFFTIILICSPSFWRK